VERSPAIGAATPCLLPQGITRGAAGQAGYGLGREASVRHQPGRLTANLTMG